MKLGVSPGAIHDSAERYSSPNCHPSTRKAGRRIVLNWIHSESSAYSFFWLYGPASAGKTAIFQAIAKFCAVHPEFWGKLLLQSEEKVTFCSHQLHINSLWRVPGLRQDVSRKMNFVAVRPLTLYMDVQLQTLIVDAFQSNIYHPFHSIPILLS